MPGYNAELCIVKRKSYYHSLPRVHQSDTQIHPQCNQGHLRCTQRCAAQFYEVVTSCFNLDDPGQSLACETAANEWKKRCDNACYNTWCTIWRYEIIIIITLNYEISLIFYLKIFKFFFRILSSQSYQWLLYMFSIYIFINVSFQSLTILRGYSNILVKSSYSSLWNILTTGQLADLFGVGLWVGLW